VAKNEQIFISDYTRAESVDSDAHLWPSRRWRTRTITSIDGKYLDGVPG
jgi:hypothetical protein